MLWLQGMDKSETRKEFHNFYNMGHLSTPLLKCSSLTSHSKKNNAHPVAYSIPLSKRLIQKTCLADRLRKIFLHGILESSLVLPVLSALKIF